MKPWRKVCKPTWGMQKDSEQSGSQVRSTANIAECSKMLNLGRENQMWKYKAVRNITSSPNKQTKKPKTTFPPHQTSRQKKKSTNPIPKWVYSRQKMKCQIKGKVYSELFSKAITGCDFTLLSWPCGLNQIEQSLAAAQTEVSEIWVRRNGRQVTLQKRGLRRVEWVAVSKCDRQQAASSVW